ncbi:MAG: ABC transporter permease [Firmicutes bacterium]|nr:ABC transporter permease [Bacillota bacterium]
MSVTNIEVKEETQKKQGAFSLKLLKFELVNLSSSIMVLIFSVIYPIGMTLLFSFVFGTPEGNSTEIHTRIFLQMIFTIPLASMLMGNALNYATEIENGSALRTKLFGFKDKTMLLAKLLANLIFLTIAVGIYSLVIGLALDVAAPSVGALFTFIIFFYIFSTAVFILGHAIATMCGRFGVTFGIVMALYFGIMILGGSMGIRPDQMPNGMRHIAMGLPLYWIASYFTDFWKGGSFDFVPLILTTIGFVILSVGLFVLAVVLKKKGKIKEGARPVYYD